MSGTRASEGGAAGRLGVILRRCSWLMRALRTARVVGAPDWLIAAAVDAIERQTGQRLGKRHVEELRRARQWTSRASMRHPARRG